MCMSCMTTADALATNSVLIAAGAVRFRERIVDRLRGRSRLDRAQETWESNAAFMRTLDLDPLETLGAPPAVPTEPEARTHSRT